MSIERPIRNLKAGFVYKIKPAFFALTSAGETARLIVRQTLLTMSIICPKLSDGLADAVAGGAKTPFRFVLKKLDGSDFLLQDGKAAILVFLTSWCRDCCRQMAELEQIWKASGSQIAVYAICVGENPASLVTWKERNEYDIPILLDVNGEMAGEFRVVVVPAIVAINSQGSIVYRKNGILLAEEVRSINNRQA